MAPQVVTSDLHPDPLVNYLLGQVARDKEKKRARRERRKRRDPPECPMAVVGGSAQTRVTARRDVDPDESNACPERPFSTSSSATAPAAGWAVIPVSDSESEFSPGPREGSESERGHRETLNTRASTSTTLTSALSSTIAPYPSHTSSSSSSSSSSSAFQNWPQAQDAELETHLPPDLVKCVRAWRQAFVGVNKILQEHFTRKWSRAEILALMVQPVQPSDMHLTTRLAVPKTTARVALLRDVTRPTKIGRPGVDALEAAVTVEFFNTHTFVRSGASTLTRRMALRQTEMYALYRAQYPMLVRKAESLVQSGLYRSLSHHLAKQLSRAKEMSAVEGWDQLDEMQRREEWFNAREYDDRVERAKRVRVHMPVIKTTDDPDQIEARSFTTFWDIIQRAGVRFLRSEPIYNCPIHATAAQNRRQLAAVQDELTRTQAKLAAARAARPRVDLKVSRLASKILPLKQKQADLEKKVETATVHQRHYETARKHVKAIEDNLEPGQVLIFRDFVNQYNEDGKKINNLVFVVLRPDPNGVGNIIDYADNIAQTKCTSRYHAYCLDFLFQRDDIFPAGTTVFISGDHGPHFWSWDTLAYQSTVYRKFGLKIHVVGLCSYHAYNRCDAHGANIKKAVRAEQLRGAGPKSPAEIAHMVNNLPAAEAKGIRVRNFGQRARLSSPSC